MFTALGSTLLTGGFNLLGNIAGSAAGVAAQREANKGNMALAEYQYSKNLEQWQRENAYNTPAAQRSRLVAAGLNPALLYGHGTLANTSASSPQFQAPKLEAYTNFKDAFTTFSDLANALLAQSTIKKNEAEANAKESEAQNTDADTKLKLQDFLLFPIKQRYLKAQTDREEALAKGDKVKADNAEKIMEATLKEYEERIAKLEAETGLVEANTNRVNTLLPIEEENERKKGKAIDQQINTLAAEAFKYRMEGNASSAYSKVLEATRSKIEAETTELTFRQKERLTYALAKLKNEQWFWSNKADNEFISQRLNAYLESCGIDPRETGFFGLVQKSCYVFRNFMKEVFNF